MNCNNYAVIDVETTGLDRNNDRVIEIAIVVLDQRFRVLRAWDSLVRPSGGAQCVLSEEVSELTGITNSSLAVAPEFSWLIPEIAQVLQGCGTWVGHNVDFDLSFLFRELMRAKGWPENGLSFGVDHICTYKEGKKLYADGLRHGPRRRKSFNLRSACEHVGLPVASALMHGAFVDAAMTARLFSCLCNDGYLPPVSMAPCLQLSEEAQLQASDALVKQDEEGYRSAKSRLTAKEKGAVLGVLGWRLMSEQN